MPKPRSDTGEKNLIAKNLIALRHKNSISQRELSRRLQLLGCDLDRNAITRIETQKRYVSDFEAAKLCQIFNVTFEELIK